MQLFAANYRNLASNNQFLFFFAISDNFEQTFPLFFSSHVYVTISQYKYKQILLFLLKTFPAGARVLREFKLRFPNIRHNILAAYEK